MPGAHEYGEVATGTLLIKYNLCVEFTGNIQQVFLEICVLQSSH